MSKYLSNSVLDPGLQYIKDNCVSMIECSAQPATYNEATVTYALADVTMASGDFTLANDTSGRKLTVAAKTGVTVDTPGTAIGVALVSTNALLAWDTHASKVLVDLVDIGSWKINFPQPT